MGHETQTAKLHPAVKIAVEIGPLAVFFLVNSRYGIFAATAAFMALATISVAIAYVLTRKLAVVPLVTCVFVLVFGGLTLWLNDEIFIKIKPTIIYGLFFAILLGGLAFGRSLLKLILGEAIAVSDEGWRILTWRWGLFFAALAVVNEIVWRTVSTDTWVTFKVFGFLPLTLAFAIAQMGVLHRHGLDQD